MKSPDRNQVLMAIDSAPGVNKSFKGTDFSQTLKSMGGNPPDLKLLRQDSSIQNLMDETGKLGGGSRSPDGKDSNMPMSFIPFKSKRLQRHEVLQNSQNTDAEMLMGSGLNSSN